MYSTTRDKSRFLMLAISGGLLIAILLLASFMSIAGAQPDDPPIDKLIIEEIPGQDLSGMEPFDETNLGPEWRMYFREDFESTDWDKKWDENLDLSEEPKTGLVWGTQLVGNSKDPLSTKSGWGICADTTCSNVDPIAPSYPEGVNSVLIAGPFDLSKADDAMLNFQLFYEANGGDPFRVLVSENRVQFTPQFEMSEDVNQGEWEEKTVSLSQFAGDPLKTRLWIAFTFESDKSAQKMGAMIDNVALWVEGEPGIFLPYVAYGFTPTPPPVTPTPTPPPGGGDYKHDFTDNITPWLERRWTNGTSFALSHDGSEDDGRQGFLNLLVNTVSSRYVIASPLVAGPTAPYNIETTVKLRSERNTGDQYGVIFGGNYTGGECPAPDFSTCFTQYYEMRVRFYYDEGADKDRMEMKLKRIDSHDSENNNNGPDLIEWTRVSDVDENDFIEWDITVEADGKIKISANDLPLESATDATYINNPYFGVIVRTEDKTDSEAKFDYLKIESID